MDINEEDFVYSVPVSEKKEGSTAIYRNPKNKETLFTVPSDIKSLIDVWDKIIKNYHEKKAV